MKTEPTQAMIDAAPQMLQALQRLTHPMASDDDIDFAIATIRLAQGIKETPYEDVRESCYEKCAADRISGDHWSNF